MLRTLERGPSCDLYNSLKAASFSDAKAACKLSVRCSSAGFGHYIPQSFRHVQGYEVWCFTGCMLSLNSRALLIPSFSAGRLSLHFCLHA
jgi:hypothetical protein